MQRIDYMEAFLMVADEQSFSKASARLYMTTAAVSQKIASLEDSLGLKLLNRSRRGLTLTESGEQYYQACKTVIKQVREAEALIQQLKERPQGKLNVLTPLGIFMNFPEIVSGFIEKYPDIHLSIDTFERIPNLNTEDIDLIFAMPDEAAQYFPGHVVQKKLFTARYLYVAAPSYLEKHSVPHVARDLENHRVLVHSARPNNHVHEFQNGERVEVKPALEANDIDLIIQSALHGCGIAKLHNYMVESYIESGRLVPVLVDVPIRPLNICMYYPDREFVKPALQLLMEYLQQHFSGND